MYKGLSKMYDLLDVLYFKNEERSPRKAVYNFIESNDISILDICTGTATNAIYIATHKKETQVVGIDISKEMLSIAGMKARKYGVQNLKLHEMNATKTSFKDKTFDVVLISLVLHEISGELAEKILLEAKRVLKSGGKILVVEWEEPKSFMKKLQFYPIKKCEPKGFNKFLNLDLEEYFIKFGLETKDFHHCDFSKVYHLKLL